MPESAVRSIPDVCEVTLLRGARAPDAAPDVVLEVAHGATRAEDYDRLRAELRGDYDDDLRTFFFVNTDVGAPEVAQRVTERVVLADPTRSVWLLRCVVPRTFVDCNRLVAPDAVARASAAGELTPGLPPWVRDDRDRALLLARHAAYRELVEAAFAAVCGAGGGTGLMLHSYAPRSIDVPVDEQIVARLRAAYTADQIGRWLLRPEVDFIVDDPDGRRLANEAVLARAVAGYAEAGVTATVGETYPLHPSTLAHACAAAFPGRTLCVEQRRDLLVGAWRPFEPMQVDPAKVDRLAAPLAAAVAAGLATR